MAVKIVKLPEQIVGVFMVKEVDDDEVIDTVCVSRQPFELVTLTE